MYKLPSQSAYQKLDKPGIRQQKTVLEPKGFGLIASLSFIISTTISSISIFTVCTMCMHSMHLGNAVSAATINL